MDFYVNLNESIAAAVQLALKTPLDGSPHVVNLAAGQFIECVNVYGQPPGGLAQTGAGLIIRGAPNYTTLWNGIPQTPGTCIADAGSRVRLESLIVFCSQHNEGSPLYAQRGGGIDVGPGVSLGYAGPNGHLMHAEDVGSSIQLWNDLSIYANTWEAQALIGVIGGAEFKANGPSVISRQGPPMPTFNQAFISAADLGIIYLHHGVTFPGGVVLKPDGSPVPAWCNISGIIDTQGQGGNNLPGSKPGQGPLVS